MNAKKNSLDESRSRNLPSRSISQMDQSVEQVKSKFVFGKYLKLDDEALKHF
jgi:hypothetical protein